jgi:hypothetical protein
MSMRACSWKAAPARLIAAISGWRTDSERNHGETVIVLLAACSPEQCGREPRVGTHRGESVKDPADRFGIARGEELGEVFDGDAQGVDRAEQVACCLAVVAGTYQTIGIVRNSGGSGSATRYCLTSR